MSIKQKILDSLTWFLAECKKIFVNTKNVVNNTASDSTTFPLAAAQGKNLQNQINQLNTKITGISEKTEKTWTRQYSTRKGLKVKVLTEDGKPLSDGVYIIEGFITGTSGNVYHRWWVFIHNESSRYSAHELDNLKGTLQIVLGFFNSNSLLVETNADTQNYTVTIKTTKI